MARPRTILIMGVGNEMRNDDRVGLVLARLLRREAWAGVRIIETGGDATAWLRLWAEAQTVVLLDATMTGARPGTLHRCDLGQAQVVAPLSASTHGLGLGHIVELARALDRLPNRLYIVGIEGADFGYGTVLSPAVTAAIPSALRAVRELVETTLLPVREAQILYASVDPFRLPAATQAAD